MSTLSNKILTKRFWNKSRVVWTIIISFFTSGIGGSLYMAGQWTKTNVVDPYMCKKIDSICKTREGPLKQDLKTIIGDVKYMRLVTEKTASEEVKNYAIAQMKYDSIAAHKYINQ